MTVYTIYCDMDGVICSFMKAFNELDITEGKTYDLYKDINGNDFIHKKMHDVGGIEFWSEMEWMPDGKELWEYLKQYNPIILSKPTDYDSSEIGKEIWIQRNLGLNIPYIFEKDKYKYASKSNILIDDYDFNINNWIAATGTGILHTSTKDTLEQLHKFGL